MHVVSGRGREALDALARDALPIWLHAEHGFWSRSPDGSELDPRGRDRRLLAGAGARDPAGHRPRARPGSLIEVKAVALAWHYRLADLETGARRANELRLHLNQLLSNQPVEILAGNRVLEIRPHGIHKGLDLPPLPPSELARTTIVAIGDDRTDEDLFAALPPEAISIRVGPGNTRARFRLEGVAAVRALLQSLVESESHVDRPTPGRFAPVRP